MLQTYIVLELEAHTLSLYQNGHLQQTFPVALGKQNTPTPAGNWHIINKKILTDSSPFGSRWMGLNHHDYGIHGTNNPAAIGSNVSLGCIRMHNAHVEQLFDAVSIGTPVIITP